MNPDAPERLRPSIHPTYARLLCAWLRQKGFDTATIFKGTRLSWDALVHDNRFISLEQMTRLIQRGVGLTDMPWLGLDVGLATQLSAHGAVGYAAVSSPDVRTMCQVITRYAPLRLQLLDYNYREQNGQCEMSAREVTDLADAREYIFCANATVLFLMIETTTGQPLSDAEVYFPYPAPAWLSHYQAIFGERLHFDADRYRVVFSSDVLDWPTLTADATAHQQSLRDCDQLLAQIRQGGALSQRIRHRLLDCDGQYPTLDCLADEMGMSRRTLIRHLKQEGSSYQALLDDVRKELAVWYLSHTDLAVEMVAERLGYQDTSNFSRTFRRWFGLTPRAMRETLSDSAAGQS